jgi:predicted ATP-binding protein involved in virulence
MAKRKDIDFKVIAIRPLTGTNNKISKVLELDTYYYFYSDYKIDKKNFSITHEKSYPDCLYDEGERKFNISAIVGKNGCGKSSIIELLLMTLNNIAGYCKVKDDLVSVEGLNVELYIKLKGYHKITVQDNNVQVYSYDESGYLLSVAEKKEEKINLKSLFYTITMNYSHYAYNSLDFKKQDVKDWLPALFHKNDSYQTPIVINPWRNNGNIDINRENSLVLSRLIANLLRPEKGNSHSFRNITEQLDAYELKLTVDKNKVQNKYLFNRQFKDDTEQTIPVYYRDVNISQKEELLTKINLYYPFGYKNIKRKPSWLQSLALEYLICKLISISIKYKEYNGYFLEEKEDFDYTKVVKYIQDICRDRTHIGYKFRQTLNFLKHQHINVQNDTIPLDVLSKDIADVINKKQTHKDKVIELIPPPIYDVDILLKLKNGQKSDITFNMISSGEKQMVYSVSSILYHLSNLNSVKVTTSTKIKYKMVQILFEEIELYFHPEMQRNYLTYLRKSILDLALDDIKNISICFVTHSPFILSDVPKANIMFLEVVDGIAKQLTIGKGTFAANIHELLSDGFFMNDGLCGAFAIEKVKETINYLNSYKELELLKNLKENDRTVSTARQMTILEEKIMNEKPKNHLMLIENIGEPILARKLKEMYYEIFPQEFSQERIRTEIARLQKLLY